MPAVVFDRLTPDQVVELFVTINAKHTKLNPSHLISLAGRRLYPDRDLAASHDIIRALNEHADSPLHGEIKLFGVGQRPRRAGAARRGAEGDLHRASTRSAARQSARFRDASRRASSSTTSSQIARVFPKAWVGRKYSIKTAMALRAFLRVVPDVLRAIRARPAATRSTRTRSRGSSQPWGELIGDARFETEGEWRQKLAGGTRGTVEHAGRASCAARFAVRRRRPRVSACSTRYCSTT